MMKKLVKSKVKLNNQTLNFSAHICRLISRVFVQKLPYGVKILL